AFTADSLRMIPSESVGYFDKSKSLPATRVSPAVLTICSSTQKRSKTVLLSGCLPCHWNPQLLLHPSVRGELVRVTDSAMPLLTSSCLMRRLFFATSPCSST